MKISDFNARFFKWWSLNKENEGQEINSSTSGCGYSQIINHPTHIAEESASFLNLILTTSPNLIRNTGVELSLFEKCHNCFVSGVTDFKVPLPPTYLK